MRIGYIVVSTVISAALGFVACASDKGNDVSPNDNTVYEHTNHLINENSPYLLAHAHNPVDWYAWGEEALNKAKAEDKPIFLSIGYAACHWCHVMERESFENDSIAAILNANFISIKVDREQRPDIDDIYMAFTTAMTGHGGWPMSVFLTSDLKPFFAGTYFPPDDRYGRPGFKKLITQIARAYRENRSQIVSSSNDIVQRITSQASRTIPTATISGKALTRAATDMMTNIDQTYGGFGQGNKFPHAMELSLLLRHFERSGDSTFLAAAELSLLAMARGGIYDHLGGGFARYATDRRWLVPHFEKMLYDNGLLVPVYVEAFQMTGNKVYLKAITGTLDFIAREMTHDNGGFYSALDADSEGEEGKFYVWHKSEIDNILGDDANEFNEYYNVTDGGNFEGKNILNIDASSDELTKTADKGFFLRLGKSRRKLLDARAERIRPLTDDKILTSWNGLALSAFCKGYQITGERRYLDIAIKNANFVRTTLYRDGKLTHSFREDRHSEGEFLEDYSYYVRGLIDLYESDVSGSNDQWLEFALELTDRCLELFADESGNFYVRPAGQSDLLFRPKDESDGARPSPGSLMIGSLLKLNRLTENKAYLAMAEKALNAISGYIDRAPGSMAGAVAAVDYYLNDKIEIVVIGDGDQTPKMLKELYGRYLPNRVIAATSEIESDGPLFEGRKVSKGKSLAFVCRNSVCKLPVSTVEELRVQLDEL